ncbi:olfactory receptor 10J4-like [Protopterus annectens]|uniref:olfactory receptor 10J4-like n=1 Tax=Protopterus annectens TaxID=7888 RepID=UPI001CF94DEC|nr:olfactory receptor 10J4-like [Protopterus annectens]
MAESNQTAFHISHFIIVGFPGIQDLPSRIILFTIFLLLYTVTVLENIIFITIIKVDEKLHSPMYILIFNLAVLDLSLPSVTIPNMLQYLLTDYKAIEFSACILQMFLFRVLNVAEGFMLAVMAYDRYQAICNPLRYHAVMTDKCTIRLSACCWIIAAVTAVPSTYSILSTPLCGHNLIFNFFCDNVSIIALACANPKLLSVITLCLGLIGMVTVLFFVVFSYTKILLLVLSVAKSEELWKAFSTCASHLLVIAVYIFATAFVAIFSRLPGISKDAVIMAGVIQNILPPLVNPMIYCLKTKEIRTSIRRLAKEISTKYKGIKY